MEKVLVTGIAGGQGRLLARRLRETFEVSGVDRSPWVDAPRDVRLYRAELHKKHFEDVLRSERPNAVVHLGFVQRFRGAGETRYDVNVRGTLQLLRLCVRHKVQRIVVVSGSYVYGASPRNPYAIDELAVLDASRSYPQIRDLVDVDHLATAFMSHEPDLQLSVLRPVNVLGGSAHSLIARYLARQHVPTVMGFDPMLQFLHEEDLAEAIALTLERGLRGAYNVVGPGAVPLHVAIRETGGQPVPLPEPLIRPIFARLFRWHAIDIPPGVIDFLKYPVTLDGSRFVRDTGFQPFFGLDETFHSMGR